MFKTTSFVWVRKLLLKRDELQVGQQYSWGKVIESIMDIDSKSDILIL